MFLILLIHAAATWALVGLIWIVQVVHYPLFKFVGEDSFASYHARHTWTITWLVVPVMLVEAGTAVLLLFLEEWNPWFLASLPLILVIWLSTFLSQVQFHQKLVFGFDEKTLQRLVRTNWIRTIAWTLRGLLVGATLFAIRD